MNDFGIGWGPKKCFEKDLKEKNLYELNLGFEIPNTKFSITYNEKVLTNTTKKFIKFMKEQLENIDDK